MYKVIKKCAKREPKNKINEQPCTYVQINVIHKCRKMWKPYREPFESLKVAFFQKVCFFFQIPQKNIPKNYPELEI